MKDLRLRLGFILALALLPLLMFSIWKSYEDYSRDAEMRTRNTELAAQIAVTDIVESLDNSREVLRLSSALITNENCHLDMAKIVEKYPRFHNIMFLDANETVQCAARPTRDDGVQLASIAASPTLEVPFTTQMYFFPSQDERSKAVLVTAYGVFRSGQLDRIFAASEDIKFLENLIRKSEPADGDEIAIFNKFGDLLVGDWQSGDLKALANTSPRQYFESEFQGVDTLDRQVSIMPTNDSQIFVAVASEKQNLSGWNRLNPLSSAMLPILAWLFGFGAIWLSTDQLILTHLRRMRKATLGFARGDRDMRVGKLDNPPASIYALGKNFDMMADRIGEREATIQDALVEKETLLREIHHRVKNNLQIIISLLNMQERKLKDKQGLAAIIETRSRINAIALVHRGLYESEDLRYVNMQTFLDRLMPELSIAFGLKERKIEVSYVATCDSMEADTATPIGLFIVEALTNSVKHGVKNGGHIAINIVQNGDSVDVSVSDDGGLPEHKDQPVSGTGSKLMNGFARQLGGSIEIKEDNTGYTVSLNFIPRKISTP